MKQGRADKSGAAGRKVEPVSKGDSPGAVDNFGQALAYRGGGQLATEAAFQGPRPPKQGIGPGGGRTVHHSGSQGKHR